MAQSIDTKLGSLPVVPAPALPAFADIAKASNDLLNKDFYHVTLNNLEVKLKTPTGVAVTVKGKQAHEGSTSASVEAKATIQKGITYTQAWNTGKLLDSKFEFDNVVAQGAKIELQNLFHPDKGYSGAKATVQFKQPQFFLRSFFDHGPSGKIHALADVTVGHAGFVAGGEVGYDLSAAAITRYAATAGYLHKDFSAALTGSNNLQLFSANYYQKITGDVEAGVKTTLDTKNNNAVGLELVTKYKLDPSSFVKAKVNHHGIAALAYNSRLNKSMTVGLGLSLDTNKLHEAGHKVGASWTFEG